MYDIPETETGQLRNEQQTSIIQEVSFWLKAAWRRRFVILIPILLSIPIGLLVVKYTEKSYETKSIVLFGASKVEDNPFSTDSRGIEALARFRLAEQIDGMQAWLKSDHVLSGLLNEIYGDNLPTDDTKRQTLLNLLRNSFYMYPLGNNALQFVMTGSESEGMGRRLEIIMSRFLDGLNRPDDNIFSSSRFLLTKSKEQLEKIEVEFNFKKQEIGGLEAKLKKFSSIETADAQNSLGEKQKRLEEIDNKLEELYKIAADNPGRLSIQLNKNRTASLEEQELRFTPNNVVANDQNSHLQDLEETRDRLAAEIKRIKDDQETLDMLTGQKTELQEQLKIVRDRLDSARQRYNLHELQFSQVASEKNLGIFSGLESAIVVGRPQDPKIASSKRLKYGIACVIFGILAGFGLGIISEILDPRVRRSLEVEALLGAPIIAELPRLARK